MPLQGPNEIFSQLEICSYRGAEFLVTGSTTAGGRKDSKKEFVNSDRQTIEDLGLKNRIFTLEGSITARYDVAGNVLTSYKQNRDKLLAALEKGGIGTLIHPFFGKLENIVTRTYTLDENMTELGDAKISIVFEFSLATGLPVESFNTPALILEKKNIVGVSVIQSIIDGFVTQGAAGGNAPDAVNKLREFTEILENASKATLVTDLVNETGFNELAKDITAFNNAVDTLVANPNDMAQDMSNLIRELDGIFSQPIDSYNAMLNMFDMGALDIPYEGTQTALSLQRQENREILNDSVRGWSLSYSYLEASQLDFETVQDIDVVSSQLEEQYQLLLDSNVAKDVLDTITDQRVDTIELLAQQKLTARQVIDVRTNLTTTRLLAYRYYGTSEDGATLALLNELQSLEVEGEVSILTP